MFAASFLLGLQTVTHDYTAEQVLSERGNRAGVDLHQVGAYFRRALRLLQNRPT